MQTISLVSNVSLLRITMSAKGYRCDVLRKLWFIPDCVVLQFDLAKLLFLSVISMHPFVSRRRSCLQVTIVLKDVNDMSPEFITPNETSVPENLPVNTVVMAVKALDRDEGRNSYIEYALSATEPGLGSMFSLGPVDGLLRVSGRLDREARANYTLEVTARDRGDPPRLTKQSILVRVLDENDNSPVFDPKQYSASVAENASIGASVLQVRVHPLWVAQRDKAF